MVDIDPATGLPARGKLTTALDYALVPTTESSAFMWMLSALANQMGYVSLAHHLKGVATRLCSPDTYNASNLTNIVASPGPGTCHITWASDTPATSRVDFGTTANYGSSEQDFGLTTTHAVDLSGLLRQTTHHYQVISMTDDGSFAISADYTFVTN